MNTKQKKELQRIIAAIPYKPQRKPSRLELAINQECDQGHSDRDIMKEVIHLLTMYRHHNPRSY